MSSNAKYPYNVMEDLDWKMDEVEELIQKLPLNPAVKAQLVNHVYEMWTKVEDAMEAAPTDWVA
jgi:hypothetical protein